MKRYDIVGLGSCLVDHIAKVPRIIGPEEKINVQAVITGFGGPTTNNLVQAARLGLSTVWIGRIGDDSNGQYILDAFEKEGMDTQFIEIVPGAMSSQTWIAVDQEGQRCIYMCSNITCTITPELVRQRYEDVIAGARLFHSELCQLPLAAVLEGARIAKEHKVPVSVDYDVDVETYIHKNNLGTQRELEELLTLTDVYKSGWSITRSLTGMDEPEQAAAQILRRGPRMVAITLGEAGSYLATTEEKVRVPAIPVKTVDSTGAGDAFMVGLGYGLLQKWPLKRMGEFSNACGSYCCQEIGAQYLGDLQEILRFLRESGLNW